jgi:ATP-binding protein involved in chromosome partitioning
VENMSYFTGDDGKQYRIFGEGGGQALARKFNTQLLAQMPLVPQIREGGDEGRPIVIKDAKSDSATKFRELAKKVAESVGKSASGPQASLEIGSFQ